jgi:hypothetical protein
VSEAAPPEHSPVRTMKRNFILLYASAIAMTQPSFANDITVLTQSENGRSSATIMQSGPGEQKPVFDLKSGPGYVIVQQRGQNSRAVIIQGKGAPDER